MSFDVIVVGGSYAGLSAAMQLARARRRIAVIDAGQRRNRFASASHGFLGRDGCAPAEIAAEAKAQLLAYPTVTWIDGQASLATGSAAQGFSITVGREALQARRLVLALGVVDELPAIDGLAERWGRSVFHCPYCHGYELQQGRIGVLASGALSLHHALLLPDWGATTLFLNGSFEPDEAQRTLLAKRGTRIDDGAVGRIVDTATLEMRDGRREVLDGLFTLTRTRPAGDLATQLACDLADGPLGPYLRVGDTMETSVPGVFACGDAARATGNVAISVGAGAVAGAAAHGSMVFEASL